MRRGLSYRLMSLTDLGRIEDAVWNRWTGVIRAGRVRGWWFTAVGLACGAVVVAVIRAIVALGAGSGNWWARVPALLSAVAVLAVVTALMLRWYLRHRADEDDLFPVLSAVVLSIVAAGLPVVTFAGLATVIWDAGVAALLASPRPAEAPVAGRGSVGDPARYCSGLLVRPYYGKPVRDAVRLALLLDEAGSADFAIDRLLRNRLQSARDLVDALDILREAGRDDLRPRVLALAAQWEEDSSFLSSGIWVSEIIRLLRFLRTDNVPPAEFLLPLGQNRKWPAGQRERVIAELRQTPFDESQWLPLL